MKKYKILGVITTTLLLGLAGVGSVSAWGPERTTFTMESPASYPTFNSITNNPTIGDERNFVRVGEVDAEVTDLTNEVEVVPGRQYLVYIYFHNNASATYNDAAHNRVGIAFKTRASSSFSTVITPENRGTITGTITAENSNPLSVWDEAYMTTSADKVLLHYVAGSAKIYNDWGTNGSGLSTNLFTQEGTLVGLNELNGIIPGCEEYHGVVTYVLQAEELGGSIDKTVSKDGESYAESVAINPGEEVYFKIAISNTGDVALTNAVIKDTLPEGLTLVPGSVELSANDSTTKDPLSDNIIVDGYNLGTIGTGNTVYITYRAKAGDDFDCNGLELKNVAKLTYDSEVSTGDSKEDGASVNVKKEDCGVPEEPTCATNPEMEGCQELPSTGPLEIVMAIVVILGIGGGGYYLYRANKTLKTVEGEAKGEGSNKNVDSEPAKMTEEEKPEAKK